MSKGLTKSGSRQELVAVHTARVDLALPLWAVLEDTQSAFFGLCVSAGKQVLGALMEADRTVLCGPAGQHDAERTHGRAGAARSAVVLGGRRIAIERRRVRSRAGEEAQLPSFAAAAAGSARSPNARSARRRRLDAPHRAQPRSGAALGASARPRRARSRAASWR